MSDKIYDLFGAKAVTAYWEESHSNAIPYLGESLFPSKRMSGLNLTWIKGYKGLPVMLAPSAFDAKPTLRDRGGVQSTSMKMPFFRESMRIGEEDRQNLLTAIAAGDRYIEPILTKLYDDESGLIDGALVNPEVMRMELIQTGKISIQSADESGVEVNYNYNYDPDNVWEASNVVTLTGADTWDGDTAKPIANILAIKRQAAAKGVAISRAVCSPTVWGQLLSNPNIGKDVFPLAADTSLSDADLQTYLLRKTGITFTVYEKMYKDLNGTDTPFMKDDRVVFLPSAPVGSTYYGTTPEEADLMSGAENIELEIVGGGIAVLTKKESLPVNVITAVSEIVLPSFEHMNSVFVMIVK